MININDILKNQTVRDLIKKTGVSDKQIDSIVQQAMSSLKGKFKENPIQMSSLLSSNKNTEADEKMSQEVEDDFLSRLIKKVGLPESAAQMVKGALPQIINHFSNKATEKGVNTSDGLQGIFDSLFANDSKKGGKNDIMSKVSSLIGSFFGKK